MFMQTRDYYHLITSLDIAEAKNFAATEYFVAARGVSLERRLLRFLL